MNIPGPAGRLQAVLTLYRDSTTGSRDEADSSKDSDAAAAFAILCHPHPQYGGNMDDMILASLEAPLLAAGVSCLRFNFRGVGASDGSYAGGQGEVEDLLAVAAWLSTEQAPATLLLGGYSFGAFVVWQALQHLKPARALLVAPPVGMMEFPPLTEPVPVDIFAGDQDSYVDVDKLATLEGARIHLLPGADHFFQGYTSTLQQCISDVLGTTDFRSASN